MAELTIPRPIAAVEDLGGLTVLRCGYCAARSVVIPDPPPGQAWRCPWCYRQQAVDWQTKGALPV